MNWFKVLLTRLVFTLFLYTVGICIVGLSIFPSMMLCFKIWQLSAERATEWRVLVLCVSIVFGYLIYGFYLIFITGCTRMLFRLNLKEGEYSADSLDAC
jgi:cytochrome bd-type quinol oxidase subunit 2